MGPKFNCGKVSKVQCGTFAGTMTMNMVDVFDLSNERFFFQYKDGHWFWAIDRSKRNHPQN
jgi:hypothetical protein